jgi:hypothetical protein
MTSNKTRPITISEKAANGLIIQEEAFAVLDTLYKSYLKNET